MDEKAPSPVSPAPPHDDAAGGALDLRSLTIVCYVLFLIAGLNGISAIIGVVIAYLKRREAAGTIWQSHFANLIRVFWIVVAVFFVGLMTWPIALGALFASNWPLLWPPALGLPFLFGLLIIPAVGIWYLYRIIRGLLRAIDEQAY